jgi:hypothetical protein
MNPRYELRMVLEITEDLFYENTIFLPFVPWNNLIIHTVDDFTIFDTIILGESTWEAESERFECFVKIGESIFTDEEIIEKLIERGWTKAD